MKYDVTKPLSCKIGLHKWEVVKPINGFSTNKIFLQRCIACGKERVIQIN